jgi:hypothetical protein
VYQLADDAKAFMGSKVNDSGTPERSAYQAAAMGAGGVGIAGGLISPQTLAGFGAHALAYTPWGQNALRYWAQGSPVTRNALAEGIRSWSPAVVNALAPGFRASQGQ